MSDDLLDVRSLVKTFGGLRAVDDCSFSVAAGPEGLWKGEKQSPA